MFNNPGNTQSSNTIRTQNYDRAESMDNFNFDQELLGRGQTGLAGFYKRVGADNNEPRYLIKEDDPATCLLEGSAYFADRIVPDELKSCVNFAHAGTGEINGKKNIAVSIQPEVKGYKPWARIITGSENRDPSSWVSFEFKHASDILASIDRMTDHAKDQLAMAICISALVGDESLHVGQFMVKEKNGIITDITRIDFGARERYAVNRKKENDFIHATSAAYKKSGQFGKDYISYLLAHPDINSRVMHFWSRPEMDAEALGNAYQQAFKQQHENLPAHLKSNALNGVHETIYKGTNVESSLQDENVLANELRHIMINRVRSLRLHAKNNITTSLNEVLPLVNLSLNVNVIGFNKPNFILFMNSTDSKTMINRYANIQQYLGVLTPPKEAIELIMQLKSKVQSEYLYHPDSPEAKELKNVLVELNDLKLKYTILNELEEYIAHLKRSMHSMLIERKISGTEFIINNLEMDLQKLAVERKDITLIINDSFKNAISGGSIITGINTTNDMLSRFEQYISTHNQASAILDSTPANDAVFHDKSTRRSL